MSFCPQSLPASLHGLAGCQPSFVPQILNIFEWRELTPVWGNFLVSLSLTACLLRSKRLHFDDVKQCNIATSLFVVAAPPRNFSGSFSDFDIFFLFECSKFWYAT